MFIDRDSRLYVSVSGEEPSEIDAEMLVGAIQEAQALAPLDSDPFIAVYADEEVTYGTLVKVLDIGASNNMKMVLATKPAPASARPE